MNGTSGMKARMAHATFAPPEGPERVARSIHIKTTAIGCRMMQTSTSRSFFTVVTYRACRGSTGAPSDRPGLLAVAHVPEHPLIPARGAEVTVHPGALGRGQVGRHRVGRGHDLADL